MCNIVAVKKHVQDEFVFIAISIIFDGSHGPLYLNAATLKILYKLCPYANRLTSLGPLPIAALYTCLKEMHALPHNSPQFFRNKIKF